MEYKKIIEINNKRISKDDLLRLGELLYTKSPEKVYSSEYKICFEDQSSISDSSYKIFDNPILDKRTCKKIEIDLLNASPKFSFNLEIYISPYQSASVSICSEDEGTYNYFIGSLNTWIADLENQSPICRFCYSTPIILISLCAIMLIGIILICKYQSNSSYFTLELLGVMLSSVFATFKGSDLLQKAFPKIELLFGPNTINKPQRFRSIVSTIFLSIIPFILSCIDQIIKLFKK